MAEDPRNRVRTIRRELLALHKQIIDAEREAWERVHGRTAPAEFLRVLVGDETFAWLRPMTELIVRIDEWLEDDGAAPEQAATWVAELRGLLSPEPPLHAFHQRYAALLQQRPEIVLAHRAVTRAMDA